LDVIGIVGDRFAVAGLGFAAVKDSEYKSQNKDATVWQWLELEFGQSILVKRRENPRPLPPYNLPMKTVASNLITKTSAKLKQHQQSSGANNHTGDYMDAHERVSADNSTVDKLTSDAIESGFNEELIGKHLLSLATYPDGIEKAIAYASIIAKARMVRLKSRNYKR
jgi:hypothetical protein